MICCQEEQAVATVAGLGAVVLNILQNGFICQTWFTLLVELLWRKYHQAQCSVIRDVGMGREDMDAVEEGAGR